ncbi:MAG: RidA family protein [Sandaracinaceae bacterium]
MRTTVNPDSLAPPRGYSNGVVLDGGRVLFVAGQVGWDKEMKFVDGMAAQFALALDNVLTVVQDAGGGPDHIGRLTIYVTDKRAYLAATKEIGAAYRERMGRSYPAMSLVQVADLLEDRALVEIEATAVLPSDR